MKWQTIGIIGGLGTETSSGFCVNINRCIRQRMGIQPHLITENVPMSVIEEMRLIHGEQCQSVRDKLIAAIERMNRLNVDAIVIPCNSVHVFFDELRQKTKIPLLNIIEETAQHCERNNLRKVGLLATTTTVQQQLHQQELRKRGIQAMVPTEIQQKHVDRCIEKILNNKAAANDKNELLAIVEKLKDNGAQGIILGCTDLGLMIQQKDADILLIDTLKVLENALLNGMN